MINFFRNIRKQLTNENNFNKYFRYALGEVVIIMLGIFFALQLQNWNEKRQQEAQFKVTLEQLYNTITDDSWHFDATSNLTEGIVNAIDQLLVYNDSMPAERLPMGLWYTTLTTNQQYNSETIQIIENLEYNTGNIKQNYLAKQLMGYGTLVNEKAKSAFPIENTIDEILLQNNIAFPGFDLNKQQEGLIIDSTYYNDRDISKAKQLLKNQNFRTQLKTQRTVISFRVLDLRELHNDALAMLRLIKQYHPKVKLLIQDVGIIGTSINGFDDVGAKSTPMTLVDEEQSIWEIELYLKQGRVKFRCRDSWAINWGGNNFPKGKAENHGNDITISEAGNYRIILNLSQNSYEFIPIK